MHAPAGAVRGACRGLSRALGLGPGQLAGLAAAAPGLLLRGPGAAEAGAARLAGLLGRSAHWRAGLDALRGRPAALARALSFDSSRCVQW